jgi:Arc/MetJ-type ribon-helix-helix transcriptional regulator
MRRALLGRVLLAPLSLAILAPHTATATSIVAVRSPDAVSISVDSEAHLSKGQGTRTLCKLYRFGNLYFAIAGMDHDYERGFNPKDIVAKDFVESGPFSSSIERIKHAVRLSLQSELERLRVEDKDNFAYAVKSRDLFSMVFAEVRAGVPTMGSFSLHYVARPKRKLSLTESQVTCPGNCLTGSQVLFLGYQDAARLSLKEYIKDGRSLAPDSISRALVEAEVKATPAEVGPPVVTLKLDTKGATLVENDPGCPVDILAPPRAP